MVALLAEGVDRNLNRFMMNKYVKLSPSSRRAWIEITAFIYYDEDVLSPSSRRAWIEII